MAKKKSLLVETHKAGAEWSIKVSGRGEDIFQQFGSIVTNFASDKGVPIVNATDPFWGPPARKRKKKEKPDPKKAIAALQELKEAVIKS